MLFRSDAIIKRRILRANESVPCVELVGQWAEKYSLRHLCPNQCFLRAFLPSREWMMFRKKLEAKKPIGDSLDDYLCRLVYDAESNRGEIATSTSSSLYVGISGSGSSSSSSSSSRVKIEKRNFSAKPPRTEFVSFKHGKVRK